VVNQDVELIRGKNVVAVISFRDTYIYATDAEPGVRPERVVAPDPYGRFHKVHHKAGNPSGTYEDDGPAYWEEITEELAPAGNASHHWVTHVEKHRQDVAAKLVADVRVDIDHIDGQQVLRLAQIYFDEAPQRDFGDNRRGASES
jgi:hypothetical protein